MFSVISLSKRLTVWCSAADRRLCKIFGYLMITLGLCLVSQSVRGMTSDRLYVDSHSDSDHAGCKKTGRLASG